MSDDQSFELETKGLDQILKATKDSGYTARVGILGSSNIRGDAGKGTAYRVGKNIARAITRQPKAPQSSSNATIGAAHEFGSTTRNLPQRSFLRMPIATQLPTRLNEKGALSEEYLADVVKTGGFKMWIQAIADEAVAIVLEAFDTAGFGKWKPSNMDKKAVKQTLVETQQLRDSITNEVRKA